MNCPVDNELLQMTERQGVEVDYCARCRGVWLDRGELDKIIERAGDELSGSRRSDDDDEYDRRDRKDYDGDRERAGPGPYRDKKKKRSFLSDMFEFGGD